MAGHAGMLAISCVGFELRVSVIIVKHFRICMGELLPESIMSVGGCMKVALLTMFAHLLPSSGCDQMSVMC